MIGVAVHCAHFLNVLGKKDRIIDTFSRVVRAPGEAEENTEPNGVFVWKNAHSFRYHGLSASVKPVHLPTRIGFRRVGFGPPSRCGTCCSAAVGHGQRELSKDPHVNRPRLVFAGAYKMFARVVAHLRLLGRPG